MGFEEIDLCEKYFCPPPPPPPPITFSWNQLDHPRNCHEYVLFFT